jgi:simple sugar transport system substrate-binding protein
LAFISFTAILLLLVAFIWTKHQPVQNDGYQFVIGMSQANLSEPWRVAMDEEIFEEALRYSNIKVVFRDAGGSTEKQANDIEELQESGVDLLIVSMDDSQKLTSVVSKVYQSIPVIVLDRAVEGYDYTLYIGNDNQSIGRQVGLMVAQLAEGKKYNIIEIQGALDSATTIERSQGFREVLKLNPNINLERTLICNWKLDDAQEDVSKVIREHGNPIDLIFADSDYMAQGAYQAASALGVSPAIIGIDGLKGKSGGLNLVKSGVLQGTFTCSTGGREAVDYAIKILNGEKDIPKKIILRSDRVTAGNVNDYLGSVPGTVTKKSKFTLGYAQLSAESDWRSACAASVKLAAKQAGIDLVFLESGQTQADEKALIRELIRRRVDIIAFSPIVKSGWDDVLTEARQAGIPVIISDRNVNSDESLWKCNIGSDFEEEARRVGRLIVQYCQKQPPDRTVHVLQIMGTIGSSASVDRDQGLREILKSQKNIDLTNSNDCGFIYSQGKKEMARYLKQYGAYFTVVYAQNDDMALGAIDAIKEFGLTPGKDIIVFGTDGTRQALLAVKRGDMYNTVECNPILGPQLISAAQKIMNGESVPLRIINSEKIFSRSISYVDILQREY